LPFLNVDFIKIGYFYQHASIKAQDALRTGTGEAGTMAALVNISTIVKVFFSRRVRIEAPDPLSLVQEPSVDLVARRSPDNALHLRWTFAAERVDVYASPTPGVPGQLVRQVADANEVTIAGLDHQTRYYFTLKIQGRGREWQRTVAERILPLKTGVNFRDLGGYPTSDGHFTRWGRLFRAGSFSRLSDADRDYLGALSLKLVCDLRSDQETEQNPDVMPAPGVEYWHHPLFTHKESQDGVRRFLLSLNNAERIKNALLESYTLDMIDRKGPLFGEILRRMADSAHLPMAFHCTAGKDRTGVTAALLLAVLGVPEDIIVADYSISNLYNATFRHALKDNSRGLRILRLTQDDLMPLLLAHPDTMRGTLRHVREQYGSYESYLDAQAGVDAATVARLRGLLLEGVSLG
jgi:protein-tyrosine phosphatase